MVKNNGVPIEVNKKPFETVYEIKNETQSVVGDQIPTLEEFMKTYENDGNLNYDDLNGIDIGTIKGYGPCTNSSTSQRRFRFGYEATNYLFGSPIDYSCIYNSAEELRNDIHNIHTKSGRWATKGFGPFISKRITDWQASEGYRYAKWVLDQYDEGYTVNLKCWSVSFKWFTKKRYSKHGG